jgi:methionyl-tRNA synthetase
VENFVAGGLKDFSISRVGLPWGIPVPGHGGHTFYVWFDALLGYLSALLDSTQPVDLALLEQRGWPARLHVIGKDILRFHAVFWPAMLMSAGLALPERVYGHGFLTREGQKMGKSLGNVLDPELLLERCGPDAVRWYLLRDIPFGEDGDFQQQRFQDLVNNDLANTIGNLLNRTSSMARKWFDGAVPPAFSAIGRQHPLAQRCDDTLMAYDQAMEQLDFRTAAEAVLRLAIDANGFLNEQAPWKRMKQPDQGDLVGADLYAVLETCRWLGLLLAPLVPDLSTRLLLQLSQDPPDSARDASQLPTAWSQGLVWGGLIPGLALPEPTPVMQRLELDAPL